MSGGQTGSEISWANGEARQPDQGTLVLWLVILMDWALYMLYAYLTLISYSYFEQCKGITKVTTATTAMTASYATYSSRIVLA